VKNIKILGCNHRTASLSVREHIAFGSDHMDSAMTSLHNLEGIDEALIVSTCNRTEICYRGLANMQKVVEWLANFHGIDKDQLSDCFYFYTDREALSHLVKVASGLDSMVLGEPQVFGQIKTSYKEAKKEGYLGGSLDGILQQIFAIAKKARSTTGLGNKPLSLASVAVQLAVEKFGGDLVNSSALIVGAGHNASLIARYLHKQGNHSLFIANRTHEKAKKLAQFVSGNAIRLIDIAKYLGVVDMVFTSTNCPTYIITKDMVQRALVSYEKKSFFIADLSVPRDVEPSVRELANVSFFIMDDMQGLIQKNQEYRNQEANRAVKLIEAEIEARLLFSSKGLEGPATLTDKSLERMTNVGTEGKRKI